MRALALTALLGLLAACQPSPPAATVSPAVAAAPAPGVPEMVADVVGDAAQEVAQTVADPVADAQLDVAQVAWPAVLAVREAIAEVLPPPAIDHGPVSSPVSPAAVALIVRHEIISPAYYTKAFQGFACPGKRSGPTAGIGSDLGVQTRSVIRDTWAIHPSVDRLADASGVIGFGPCRDYRRANIDIRTPFLMAQDVFATKLLPEYHRRAARAFRNGWDGLPANAQGALVVTVYVRGEDMRDAPGAHQREEMRQLRDVCVPAADTECMATEFRNMCQRFEHRPKSEYTGLCRRFTDTARLAVQA